MRVAYADPPYLGCGSLYAEHHPNALDWDDPETHRRLIGELGDKFPEGWAMSLSSPSLRTILPMCPADARVASWTKPFCSFKPGVTIAYAWEPVIWRGGRKRTRAQPTVRDYVSANITLKRGLTGAKPREFCRWLFDLLNLERGDDLFDMFPGTGWQARPVLPTWRCPMRHRAVKSAERTVLVREYLRCRLGAWQTISAHIRRWPRWRGAHRH